MMLDVEACSNTQLSIGQRVNCGIYDSFFVWKHVSNGRDFKLRTRGFFIHEPI